MLSARTVTLFSFAVLSLACAPALTGCSSGPSTKQELCAAYDDLGRQVLQGNGIIGNPVFHKAESLGDAAARYPDTDLSADAAALKKIASSKSTSGIELSAASRGVARVCGHPLSYLFG